MELIYGDWVVDGDKTTLEHKGTGYQVDLRECTTSAEVLDWICQLASTSWITDESLGQFVKALNDVLTPQALLCGGGKESGPLSTQSLEVAVKNNIFVRDAVHRVVHGKPF